MAWSTVGTINSTWTCHGWKGWLSRPMDQGEAGARTGETGSIAQKHGTRGPESEIIVTRICDSEAAAEAAAEALEDLSWDIVPMTDHFGRYFPYVRIHEVRAPVRACKGPGVSASQATHRVVATLRVEVLPSA